MPVVLNMSKLEAIEKKFPGTVDAILKKLAGDTDAEIKRLMSGPKSGLFYGSHQASAPGEPPAIDTGALINSVGHRKRGKDWIVYAGTRYAAALEFGRARVKARPFMRPAVMNVGNRIPKKLLVKAVTA